MALVYVITNKVSGKQYVGCTIRTLAKRWNIPPYYDSKKVKKSLPDTQLFRDISQYGRESFFIEELEECENEVRYKREAYWINKLNTLAPNGYNISPGSNKETEHLVKSKAKAVEYDILKERDRQYKKIMSKYTDEQVKRWEEFESQYPRIIRKTDKQRNSQIEAELRKKRTK